MKRLRRGGDVPPSLRTLYNVVPAEQTFDLGQVDRENHAHHGPPGLECLLDHRPHAGTSMSQVPHGTQTRQLTPRGPRCIVSHRTHRTPIMSPTPTSAILSPHL